MFKKAPTVKSLSVLRSSDRKKVVHQIVLDFGLDSLSQDAKNSLLPEGAQAAKFVTNRDEPGTLYFDPEGTNPLWIKIVAPSLSREVLLPTVYTMWKTPLTVRSVATWNHVLEKLQSGADLMTPGLTSWHSEIKAGDITAIALEDKVPVAIGVAAFAVGRLVQSRGGKGKAVYLVHCHQDELWALGNKMDPPPQPTNDPTVEVLQTSTQQLSLDESEKVDGDEATEQPTEELPPAEEINKSEEKISHEPSTAEIDEAFKSAAIYGLYQIKSSHSQTSISFPLLSSTLVSSHLNPFLPEGFEQYNFKKTSWKKAATFLKKCLEKEGVVKTKDRGGDTVVLSINWEHKLITGFHPYDLATKQSDKAPKQPTQETPALIKIQELYKPSGKTLKLLLESLSKKKEELYTASQIREVLTEYITKNEKDLVNGRNPRLIKIDYNLAPLLSPEEANTAYLPRDKILDRLLNSCQPHYKISNEKETQVRRGKTPKINIVLEKRQGRKTVTRIWGLEPFFLDPNELADELRNACATSASVGALVGSSPKQPVMEVLVQGPQTSATVEALEKRGVKKQFIIAEDKRK